MEVICSTEKMNNTAKASAAQISFLNTGFLSRESEAIYQMPQ